MTFQKHFLISIFLVSIFSCTENEPKQRTKISAKDLKEPLEKINKTMNAREVERITAYIERRKWDMKQTGTGLRYMIYEEGKGDLVKTRQHVSLNFSVELLNGTKCYSSDEKGSIEFLVGRDQMESGMHEGILLLKVGYKARFIMPAHLAHGFVGDDKKIPKQSTVVYDIEVLSVR